MENLNLRVGGMPCSDWCEELRDRLKAADLAETVIVAPASPPSGALGALDPSIVVAMITGGVQIVATVITLLGKMWLEKRKVRGNQQPDLVVVIQGSEGTRTISFAPTELTPANNSATKEGEITMAKKIDLLRALEAVGTLRAVEEK